MTSPTRFEGPLAPVVLTYIPVLLGTLAWLAISAVCWVRRLKEHELL